MWKELLREVSNDLGFNESATIDSIILIETKLNVHFPGSLKSLLLESNGVKDEFDCDFIWPLNRILKDNLSIRDEYSEVEDFDPFDDLLFFSDAGNGDLFAFLITGGNIDSEEVYVWIHEDGCREMVSSSLKAFLKGWLDGTISI